MWLHSVKPKSTWKLVKPHFQTLVSSFVFPQLSFTPARQEQWQSDPVDYVRASVGTFLIVVSRFPSHYVPIDEYGNFATPVSSATTFLFSLVSNRTKSTFMPILGFINDVLRSCVSFLKLNCIYADEFLQECFRSTKIWRSEYDRCIRSIYNAPPGSEKQYGTVYVAACCAWVFE